MSDWILFNGITIRKSAIIWVKCFVNTLIIEIGTYHYSFNERFESLEEFNNIVNSINSELRIEHVG